MTRDWLIRHGIDSETDPGGRVAKYMREWSRLMMLPRDTLLAEMVAEMVEDRLHAMWTSDSMLRSERLLLEKARLAWAREMAVK